LTFINILFILIPMIITFADSEIAKEVFP